MTAPAHPDAADRVPRSHAQTRVTLRFSLAFIAAAAIAAAVTVLGGVDRWLALHLFLAGGAVLAISAVSLMLTVTWSAAPAPPDRLVITQRWCVSVGAAGIAVGRGAGLPDAVVGAAGAAYLAGLVLLATLLVTTVRRGTKRRFDTAVASYVAALTAGLVGSGLGLTMALTEVTTSLRSAHVAANVLGLVGLTIAGTLPYFASTVGRSKMNKRATDGRLRLTLAWQSLMVAVTVAALAGDIDGIAAAGLAGYGLGLILTLAWMPALAKRQFEWAGPRLIALWTGCGWWIAATAATAFRVGDGQPAFADDWVVVLAVAGYGQIMWGSLAYLLPMLRGGGHELLGEGFAATRSWLGLVAANVAGFAIAFSCSSLAATAVAVWVTDSAVRAARVGTRRADRPTPSPVEPSHVEPSPVEPSPAEE